MNELTADYIIIGAGSSGCVIANRLSANPNTSVILLEAGGRDWNPWIHIPVGYFKTMHNPATDWCYTTEPDPGLNNRKLAWPRGKVLGGSSSINGLLYVRGQPQDYDHWRQLGNAGWGWDDVKPLFLRSERQERGADDYHGTDGTLSVSDPKLSRAICDAWVQAAQTAGYPFNADFNGASQEGVGYFQLTTQNGRRCSAATAFLKPARHRPNLRIITRAQVQRLAIENRRATGVHYRDASGTEHLIKANREVILSAGAIGSPQILMLSGIGEAAHLRDQGIEVIANLPGVGRNLQDHLQARLVFTCHEPTLNNEARNPLRKLAMAAQYAWNRSGPMAMAASLATGFLRTAPHLETPDIQFHIQPWSADSPGEGVHPFSAFTMSVCQLRPESRGEIRLKSPNPMDHPLIQPNYLATRTDQQTLVEGIKIARHIAGLNPLRSKISGELRPGPNATDDAALLDWARNTATTIYHPVGTCKMGDDPQAVVNHRLQVHGIENLRIADCSIMPSIISGNTNAPAIMIGEKLSDLLRAGI
ncbi:choline dehydrogenase [Cypionkella sp.]|uniref:GMC family oxidoreductase n=1 Tax=Cypionkella sp. TaxID=2811411 RepID=UPI00260FE2AA|nr:choline dehydrogenase [Cypionkella sp.]MDB5666395.1 Choline dehydrogenase [Cypionkella sp.]